MRRVVIYSISFIFIIVTFLFPFTQISDFGQFWRASSDLSQYIKGGALIFLYALFSLISFPPFLAALLVNLASYFLLAWSFPSGRIASIILLFIGLSWAAWAPIINSDLPSAALIVAGTILLLRDKYILTGILLACGLSMRMQSLLVAVFVLIVLFVVSFRFTIPRRALLVLALAIAVGWGIDAGLKIPSIQQDEIAKSQRVPLYAGLIATEPGPKCGEITPYAKEIMLSQQRQPLASVLDVPPNLPELLMCKWSKMILYGASGSLWLQYTRNDRLLTVIFYVETFAVNALKITCLALLFLYRKSKITWLALLIVIGYLGLHTVFEIQPRYLIPPIALSLTLCLNTFTDKRIPLG